MSGKRFPTADAFLAEYRLPAFLEAGVRVGLVELLSALEDEVELNAHGQVRAVANIHDDLRRLQAISDDRIRYPEIAEVEIKQPMFILGLPRCGTSLLHALIGEDPQIRTPLMWEVADPSPPPASETAQTDPRIAAFWAYIEADLGDSLEELMKAHPIGAMIPQECGSFMTTSFHSSNPVMLNRIPGFYRWFLGADVTFRYQVHKMWLQHLAWRNPRRHWVLKIQEHMYSLPELRSVYPDAIFVQPHRDPVTVIASISQLIHGARMPVFDVQDRAELGQEMLHLWHDGQVRMMAYRRTHPDLPIHDLRYKDLASNPTGAVREIYDRFNWDFTAESEAGIARWLAENPAGRHGKHVYQLADFGLTAEAVREVYADYIDLYRDYI